MVEKSLYRIAEAAHYLGVSRSTIYELMAQGLLQRTTVTPLRITWESLKRYRNSIVERQEE